MKTKITKFKTYILLTLVSFVIAVTPIVNSHCQIPCGIYDDNMRLKIMAEHITTIEKSITTINQLSTNYPLNANQITRWVKNKEVHADKLSNIIIYYFMAQRLEPIKNSASPKYKKYIAKLTILHEMLVYSMKAKQNTDTAITQHLNKLLAEFKKEYSGIPKKRVPRPGDKVLLERK